MILMRLQNFLLVSVLAFGAGWWNLASAASQTSTPTTCTSVSGVGTQAWSNPGNAGALDATYATASVQNVAGSTTTNYLQCTGYSFNIPSTATINGITVTVARASSSSGTQDNAVRIIKGGAIGSTDRSTSTAYTNSIVSEDHGSTSDLWGLTWAPSDINAANFGAAFSAKQTSGSTTRTAYVDVIQITVTYTVPFSCSPPSNIPSGVTVSCVCDTFARATLNPSTIFGANWIVSTSDSTGILPSIVNSGYLRLTNNTGNNAKAATVPGFFPAAGNYISVEFQHFAYNGSGADGIAVTLSDYSVPAVPGAYGGSLGYAQKTGINGFAGGWIGVALDEYGNYQNPTEGRIGGPGAINESVGLRGSGSGTTGYQWIAGTSSLSPQIDSPSSTTAALGYFYQVVVDARNDPTSTSVTVNRDTGSGYTNLINVPNVYSAATAQGFTQSAVPTNWQISFTGSTGGSTNIHELSGVRICAQSVAPPSGGTASGFNAIDEAYGTPPSVAVQNYLTGHIYMKIAGVPFKLNVAALNNNQIQTAYVGSGTKNVTVKLVDNIDSVCVLDNTLANYCSAACQAKTAITSQVLPFVTTDKGQRQSTSFTVNSAYKSLVAIITDGTSTACSTDSFSVRPSAVTALTSSSVYTSPTSTPVVKAGSGTVNLTATTTVVAGSASNYTGALKVNTAALTLQNGATVVGTLSPTAFSNAVSGTGTSTSTTGFTYSEVGGFQLNGYDPTVDFTTPRGIYDDTWSTIDGGSKNDCNAGSYSNVKDANGKYGCNFGLSQTVSSSPIIGRFIPDHFAISGSVTNRSDIAACNAFPVNNVFTYFGEQMTANFTLTAQNASGSTTQNYVGNGTGTNIARINPCTASNYNFGASDRISYPGVPGYWTAAGPPSSPSGFPTPDIPSVSCTPSSGFAAGVSNLTAIMRIPRPSTVSLATAGPFSNVSIGAKITDLDGATVVGTLDTTTSAGTTLDHALIGTLPNLKYGRLVIDSAYGSELFQLAAKVRAEFWNAGVWTTNVTAGNGTDSCTVLNNTALNATTNNMSLTPGAGAAVTTGLTGTTLSSGTGTIVLSKPTVFTSKGSVIVKTNSSITSGPSAGTPRLDDYLPGTATETFGVFKAGPVIYIRETF